jgi:hypothetical protein
MRSKSFVEKELWQIDQQGGVTKQSQCPGEAGSGARGLSRAVQIKPIRHGRAEKTIAKAFGLDAATRQAASVRNKANFVRAMLAATGCCALGQFARRQTASAGLPDWHFAALGAQS